MNPESLFLNCSVSASDLTISGNGYQGGFAGAMANTSAINCNVNVSDKLTGDKWTVKELAPGQTSETFRTSYTVTEKDVLAGTVKNKATAKGESPDKDNLETKVDPGIREEAVETSKPSFCSY